MIDLGIHINAEVKVLKSLEIPCAIGELRDDGIICFRMKDNYTVDIADIRQITDAIGELGGGKKYPVLTVADSFTTLTQEAVEDSLNPYNFKYTLADAFVIKAFYQRLIANFYIKAIKPPVPTKYFDKEDKAEEWLRVFV